MVKRLLNLFDLDLRSLALMRIACAAVAFYDLWDRARFLKDHYTDWGLFPRWLLSQYGSQDRFSVHAMSGSPLIQYPLFILTGIALIALMFGYRTRWATFFSWLLVFSMQNRVDVVNYGADVVLRLLLFWGMLLPWGARLSIDRTLARSDDIPADRCRSWGTAAYVTQFCLFYAMAGFLKTGDKWLDGTAVYYALAIDEFVTPLGVVLREHKQILTFLTYAVLYFERYSWILVLIPFRTAAFRIAAIAAYTLMQIGFGSMLHVGIFPLISTAFAMGFIPSCVWEKVECFRKNPDGLRVYCDGRYPNVRQALKILTGMLLPRPVCPIPMPEEISLRRTGGARLEPAKWAVADKEGRVFHGAEATRVLLASAFASYRCPVLPAACLKPIRRLVGILYEDIAALALWNHPDTVWWLADRPAGYEMGRDGRGLAIAGIVIILCWNWATLPGRTNYLPLPVQRVAVTLGLDQSWSMFAPYPRTADSWYVIPGKLRNGEEVDVFKKSKGVTWERPRRWAEMIRSERWRKYLEIYQSPTFGPMRMDFAKYLCREWNNSHPFDKQLLQYDIYILTEDELPGYRTSAPRKQHMWKHYCFEELAPKEKSTEIPSS